MSIKVNVQLHPPTGLPSAPAHPGVTLTKDRIHPPKSDPDVFPLDTIPDLADEESINSLNTSSLSDRGPPVLPLSRLQFPNTRRCVTTLCMCVCVCVMCCLQVAGRQPIGQQIGGEPQAPHLRAGRARHLLYVSSIKTHHRCICSRCFLYFLFHIFSFFSSAARPGRGGGAAAGMRGLVSSVDLGEYPPRIHQQTIKIVLQSSITPSLPLSGLPLSPEWEKKKSPRAAFLMANSKPRLSFVNLRRGLNAEIERRRRQESGRSVSLYSSRLIE